MRHPKWLLLAAPALLAAVPAAAQGHPHGPAIGHPAPIPAPGGTVPAIHPNPLGPAAGPMRAPPPRTAARVWQNGRWTSLPHPGGHVRQVAPNRWGGKIHGRWHGGFEAPGGWSAYRRLGRGHRLPNYWMGQGFRIPDYLAFGLAAPPPGYFWVRYYDDAVLVDGMGEVWDSVGGVAWTGGDYSEEVGAPYVQPIVPVDPDVYYDSAPYPQEYAPPPPVAMAPPPPRVVVAPPPVIAAPPPPPPAVQVRTYPPATYGYGYGYDYAASSYQAGAYYYGAPTTTVVVTTAPVVTTTTVVEEVIEDVVTTSYVRAKPKRVVRKHRAKPRHKPKPKCCVCVCR